VERYEPGFTAMAWQLDDFLRSARQTVTMAILFNDEWIIPHIPKCGGTTLAERLPRSGLGFEAKRIGNTTPSGHLRLQDFEEVTGINPLDRKIIAVIRDPWEREISRYSYLHYRYEHGDRTQQVRRAALQSFEDFVCDPKNAAPYIYWENCYPNLVKYDVIESSAIGWDEYLFWLTIDGKQHPQMELVPLEDLNERMNVLFKTSLVFDRWNSVPHVNVTWTKPAVRALYHKYWWGIRSYEMAA